MDSMEDQENSRQETVQGNSAQGGSFMQATIITDRATSMGRNSCHYDKCCPPNQCMVEDGILGELHITLSTCSFLTKKVLSEFIGTFVLLFAAAGTGIVNEKTGGNLTILGCASGAGLAVMIVIFSTGHISGAHINPAVTLSFASLRHFPWAEVPLYIIAQVGGSISASYALKGIFHPDLHGGVTIPHGGCGEAFALEFVTSFILMFVITAVATDTRAVGELAGIAVGVTVLLNILISGSTTGGSMNPVRTLGPAIAAGNYEGIWLYIVAPILGMQLGAGAYSLIRLKDPETRRSFRSFRT
ncbi:hypothetical protein O6H91_18G010300 [Diphasiastrum complanatum]|uniref:Uncharacterized protein n=1 Tax=Diphasiastrum complanatum TaxID=34168 RepID=A0ACC2AYE1_DIPCM|nr:hypothetical protein O6H91_18G010300 [Diphasiastrum complanatum]